MKIQNSILLTLLLRATCLPYVFSNYYDQSLDYSQETDEYDMSMRGIPDHHYHHDHQSYHEEDNDHYHGHQSYHDDHQYTHQHNDQYQYPSKRSYSSKKYTDYDDGYNRHHGQRGYSRRNRYDCDDRECSCQDCDKPTSCCRKVCRSCPNEQSQSNIIYVPVPMVSPQVLQPSILPPSMMQPQILPMIVEQHESDKENDKKSTNVSTASTTTTVKSTTITKTTTAVPTYTVTALRVNKENLELETDLRYIPDDLNNIIVKTPDKLANGNNRFLLTSLRRTKPTWVPKFGIVPIPNTMAEKLMTHLRKKSMRRSSDLIKKYNF